MTLSTVLPRPSGTLKVHGSRQVENKADSGSSVSGPCIVLDSLDALHSATQDGHEARALWQQVVGVNVPYPQGSTLQPLGCWPPALCSFRLITSINLSGHRMVHVPATISHLQQLKVLNVSHNTLTALPAEMGELSALTELDISHNHLLALPPSICKLTGLVALNAMGNRLKALPEGFGSLVGLVKCGLKSNQLATLPPSFSQLTNLVELFITDNKLTSLPAGSGALSSLVKLQASFNPFEQLPSDVFYLPKLEMFRLAVGNLEAWPTDLLEQGGLPKLAWCSLGGNPAAVPVPALPADLPVVKAADLGIAGKLGAGASGDVFDGTFQGRPVAVKLFRGEVSPDGRVEEELGISCTVQHQHLTRVRALIQEPQGLVLDLVKGKPLAMRPTSQHLLRCKWQEGQQFSLGALLKICSGVASGLAYLHGRGICHGDVYAHNVLVDADNHPTLCDFGASYCYAAGEGFWEAMEVHAFGLFLGDMVQHLQLTIDDEANIKQQLQQLVAGCLSYPPRGRPSFREVVEVLHGLVPVAAAGV